MTRCPGPENASLCEHRARRYGGCQGRMPELKRVSWIEWFILALMVGLLAIGVMA